MSGQVSTVDAKADIEASKGEMNGVERTDSNVVKVLAMAANHSFSSLKPVVLERRRVQEKDVAIQVEWCGVCASDVHQCKNEWKNSIYPVTPGHEMTGRVIEVGSGVTKFKKGDVVAVGTVINSCRVCPSCKEGHENYCECEAGFTGTYNGGMRKPTKEQVTRGGYSEQIVIDENYVLRVPDGVDLAEAAPLLCAGVTVYSPLKHWHTKKGKKVAIAGLGGLGHLAVKIAVALGAEVSVITTSPNDKGADATRNGAVRVIDSTDKKSMEAAHNTFDLILSTISVPHDPMPYVELLRRDGTLVIIGQIGPLKGTVDTSLMVTDRKAIASTLTGSIAEAQEVLDFCAKHKIFPDIKRISVDEINDAFHELHEGEAGHRNVIDMSTLRAKVAEKSSKK